MNGNEEDLYGGDGPTLAQEPAPDAKEKKSDEGDAQTYLVNKEVCPGMKVGDELKGHIVAIHESEYECEYEKGDDTETDAGDEDGMASAAGPGAGGGGEADSMYG